MQDHQHQEEEEEKEEPGPENAFGKSPFQLTAEDVYDISYVVGRELLKISSEPQVDVPTRVAQLQFKIVRILEMLEALVNENNLTVEELKMERENLKKEVEGLRREGPPGTTEQVGTRAGANSGTDLLTVQHTVWETIWRHRVLLTTLYISYVLMSVGYSTV